MLTCQCNDKMFLPLELLILGLKLELQQQGCHDTKQNVLFVLTVSLHKCMPGRTIIFLH